MTADVELPTILRDIAAGRRNTAGDFWSRDYCNQAAAEIEALREQADKFKWQVRDTCVRAEKVERDKAMRDDLIVAMLTMLQYLHDGYPWRELGIDMDKIHANVAELGIKHGVSNGR